MTGCVRKLQVAVVLIALAAPVAAQEGPVAFEFSFSNPGARSMGLGGAFAALADDATAAFANPAGLVQLLESEVSLEGRWWSYDIPYVAGGRASGEPTGVGADTVHGLRFGTSSNDLTDISFMSLVYPREKWSVALYRHTWADFTLASSVNGLFGEVDGELDRSEDVIANTELRITNNGVAGGYEITDALSIGLGIVYYEAELDSFSEEFAYDEDDFFAPNPYLPELLDTSYFHRGRDSGISLHAGLLWRPTSQWSVGGFFRQGPKMDIRVTEVLGQADDDGNPPGFVDKDFMTPLHMPDVFGVGAAYRSPDGTLTVSLEWDRVCYSNLGDDLDGGVYDADQVAMSDGDELRLGVEYVFIDATPVVAVRLGAWHDPAHGLGSGPDADLFERTIFYGGDDQMHYSGGVGLVFDSFQLDFGIDVADTVDTASLSIVYRF